MEKLKDRLKCLRVERGYSQPQLAKLVGISQSAIAAIETGRNQGTTHLPKIADVLGVDALWLQNGGPKPEKASFDSNVGDGPTIGGSVPLISWVQAGAYTTVVDNYSPGDGEEMIPTTIPIKRHTYALKVRGDSMEPLFQEGMILIIEPDAEPKHGSYVIVKNGDEEATFKQLIKDGPDWFLKPLNPRFPIKPFTSDMEICGVVRGAEMKFF